MNKKIVGRERRKLRIRKRITGTAERPRVSVFRTAKHIYAQAIDDVAGTTVAHASTLSREIRETVSGDDKTANAKKVGAEIAEQLKKKGIESVVFDRSGYLYHGRVRAVAEAAREAGLKF